MKQRHGKPAQVISVSDRNVDPNTGEQTQITKTTDVGVVIVLPSRILGATLAAYRTRNHPGGAFYTEHETIGLIDRNNLPKDFKISMADIIVFPATTLRFRVAGILDLVDEQFVELGLSDCNSEGFR